jgi:hypothetical protein
MTNRVCKPTLQTKTCEPASRRAPTHFSCTWVCVPVVGGGGHFRGDGDMGIRGRIERRGGDPPVARLGTNVRSGRIPCVP